MPNHYCPVIVQGSSTSSPTSSPLMPSSASSYTQTNSSSSSRSYISTTTNSSSSSPRPVPFVPLPHNAIKPARVVREYANGHEEFVHTGRPQGGNPNGGPPQHPEGYIRVSKGKITIHNTGGQSKGNVPADLGTKFENGPEHERECRKRSRWSDNQGLCFCSPRTNQGVGSTLEGR